MIYLAGPMTGMPNWNHDAFCDAASRIEDYHARSRESREKVHNPAMHFDGRKDLPREQYMRKAVVALMHCSQVYLLDGWENSEGAKLEVAIARELGLPVKAYFETKFGYGVQPLRERELPKLIIEATR